MAFQEITPEQLKSRLLSLAENKKGDIQNLNIEPCGFGCLSFYSKTGIQFKIKTDFSVSEPEIVLSSSSKTLKIPSSLDWLHKSSSDNYLKSWLVGSEIHPYTNASKNIQHTEAQNVALKAFRQALGEGAKSFLHIAPSNAGKTLVLAKALKEKLQNYRTNKISLVTVHQVHLVDQLFEAIQQEFKGTDVTVINWNKKLNRIFSAEIERSVMRSHPTVLVITSHSLKAQLSSLQNGKPEIYDKLVKNTDGIYIDKAHHLGAFYTRLAVLTLQERSGAFLYGDTATPVHREVNIRDFFEREHWSYLNGTKKEAEVKGEVDQATRTTEAKREERGETEDLFYSHSVEKIMEQLFLGISKGEITFFNDLYIIKESSFNVRKNRPVFIQSKSQFLVLNPYYYSELTGLLHRILRSNKKGFIVTATISEANRLTQFLNKAIEGIQFETYHSGLSKKRRQEVFRNSEEMESHYIVAVRALDEGVNLPHLSAYIDLNANVSVKQMIHRIGRVLRLHTGKLKSEVLFLADYRNVEMAKALLSLLEAVNLSHSQGIRYRDKSGDTGLRTPEETPLGKEELQRLREELRKSVQSFWDKQKREKLSEDEVIKLFRRKNIMSNPKYKKERETDRDLQKIPLKLHSAYPGWSWYKVKGESPPVRSKERPSEDAVIELFRRKNIMFSTEYETQRKDDPDLQKIPLKLHSAYPGFSWYKVREEPLPIEKPSSEDEVIKLFQRKNIMSDPEYQIEKPSSEDEVIKLFRRKNIMSDPEYQKRRKTDSELQILPKNIYSTYPGFSWYKVKGKSPPVRVNFKDKPSEDKVIQILRRKNIMFGTEYETQRKDDPELQKIPKNLHVAYPGFNWSKVRGESPRKPPVKKVDKLSEDAVIKLFQRKNIMSGPEYQEQRKTDRDLQMIPKKLSTGYPGWSWYKLRRESPPVKIKNKPSEDKVIKVLQGKNIMSDPEYQEQRKTDPELQKFPENLHSAYREFRWYKIRGESPPLLINAKNKPSEDAVIKIFQGKNIMSDSEYQEQRKTDRDLQMIPKKLSTGYPGWSWSKVKRENPLSLQMRDDKPSEEQ